MTSNKKFNRYQFLSKTIFIPALFFLLAFSIHKPSVATSSPHTILNDTVPPKEISSLKRADVYVVIMDSGMVKIRLKNRDSIMINRTDFEALPENVKKEISAYNDGIFSNEQIESTYPGGPSGWMSYLNKTFRYPEEAVRRGIKGTVVVQFIVDEEGKVSDIEAISGPTLGGLREETIRVIKRSGKWNPATWNGYKVKSYKRQPLTFALNPQ